jgi:hypothetical protein
MMVRLASRVLGYAALLGVTGIATMYRFANMTLTETQLFVALWWLFPIALVGIGLVASGESRP